MRIEVIGTGHSRQARAYAEYRLFATLARHTRDIRTVRVVLAPHDSSGPVTCVVHLILDPAGCVRARAHGSHVVGAIDRAAERIGDLMDRRSPARRSS
jgi:ribosome-associated translation inhibitor RaiA